MSQGAAVTTPSPWHPSLALQRTREGIDKQGLSQKEWWEFKDNGRWGNLASQYLRRYRARGSRRKSPLGVGASPIVVIDGRYLVTTNTT